MECTDFVKLITINDYHKDNLNEITVTVIEFGTAFDFSSLNINNFNTTSLTEVPFKKKQNKTSLTYF